MCTVLCRRSSLYWFVDGGEDSQAVRFKLSDDGDSGKVIVIEKSPEHRDTKRVFDNGLSLSEMKTVIFTNWHDYKEVEPTPIRKPEEVTQSPNQVPAVEKDEENLKETIRRGISS